MNLTLQQAHTEWMRYVEANGLQNQKPIMTLVRIKAEETAIKVLREALESSLCKR
jgi:hypothetical protein